jgi:hypothetical protein
MRITWVSLRLDALYVVELDIHADTLATRIAREAKRKNNFIRSN